MISVAAELAGMHPQTLRIYESRGLITPKRSSGNTRLYSQEDVDRLRRIQELTSELGMNLAGVEKVFELEQEMERMHDRMTRLEREAERDGARDARRRSSASALVRASSWCPTSRLDRRSCRRDMPGVQIPIAGRMGRRALIYYSRT